MHSLRSVVILIVIHRIAPRRLCLNETVFLRINKAHILGMRLRDLHGVGQLALVERWRVAAFHVWDVGGEGGGFGAGLRIIPNHISLPIFNNLLRHIDQLAVGRLGLVHGAAGVGLTVNVHGVATLEL